MSRPVRSWLYAPGNNPELMAKVFGAGADAVILDLEDAVPPPEKARARDLVAETLAARPADAPGPPVYVRVNHPSSGLTETEVKAIVAPALAGIRLPKVEDPETVQIVDNWLALAEAHAGVPVGQVALVCSLESALGIWRAVEIGAASKRVRALGFGAADFARDVGASVGPDAVETLYARSRLVLASRVAGIQPPVDSVYARIQDEEGLERTTRQGRALGFFGRSAIHPRQVSVINRVYTPTADEVARAQEIVAAAATAEASGRGALQLENGDFVDVAIVRRAEGVVRLAEALSGPGTGTG